MYFVGLALTCLALMGSSMAEIDADKAAELSREIREHFRLTGANWVSPKMFRALNLTRNSKPIMFVFTSRSCSDCRDFMNSWTALDRVTLSSITAQFLSVLAMDDYVLELTPQYSPEEADYLPRVLFADPDGTLCLQEKGPAEAGHLPPYYYETAEQVVKAMQRVLVKHWEYMGTDVFAGDLQDDIA